MADYIPTTSTPSTEFAYGGTFGNLFTVPSDVSVPSFQYYQKNLTVSKPSALRLWRVDTGTLLTEVTAVPNPTVVGWQTVNMSSPVNLVAGPQYIVGVQRSNTSPMQGWASAAPAVGSTFSHVGVRFGTSATAPPSAASSWELCDAGLTAGTVGPLPPEEPPAEEPNPGTVDPGGSLAYWLHADTVNPDSAPKQTLDAILNGNYGLAAAHAERIAMAAVVGSVSSSGNTTVMGRLAAISTAVGAVAALVEIVKNTTDLIKAYQDEQGDLRALIQTLEGNVSSNIGRDHIAIPASGWLLREQIAGAGPATWDEPADRYVWTMTNPEARTPGIIINGINYFLHRAWWAPLNISLVGNHRTFVGQAHEFYEVGQRLPGVIFFVEEDIEWTLQAYDYSPGA